MQKKWNLTSLNWIIYLLLTVASEISLCECGFLISGLCKGSCTYKTSGTGVPWTEGLIFPLNYYYVFDIHGKLLWI